MQLAPARSTAVNQTQKRGTHLIIGGTTKAATTSLFAYLSEHPQVVPSKVKEVGFFLDPSEGGQGLADYREYLKWFVRTASPKDVYLEASPGYIHSTVAGNEIKKCIPDAKIVFMLREPVSRFLSWFQYAKSLNLISASTTIDQYIEQNLAYRGVRDEHLSALSHGRYSNYLTRFFETFPREQIHTLFYETLAKDAKSVATEVCSFVGIDPRYFENYVFGHHNKTFRTKSRLLHGIYLKGAHTVRRSLTKAPFLFHALRPAKNIVWSIYSKLNCGETKKEALTPGAKELLTQYYDGEVKRLKELGINPPWYAN